jgi:hypothetical protein
MTNICVPYVSTHENKKRSNNVKYIFMAKSEFGIEAYTCTNHITADDLMSQFYYFMLGAGFHPESVNRSLQMLASEKCDTDLD